MGAFINIYYIPFLVFIAKAQKNTFTFENFNSLTIITVHEIPGDGQIDERTAKS